MFFLLITRLFRLKLSEMRRKKETLRISLMNSARQILVR